MSDLLDNVASGEMRVPRFQRPYVWTPDDMIQLFDSVLRGYPIGSLLIWQTDRKDISSLDAIGPITLPKDGPTLRSYVVDGHQRLATLLGVLTLPESYPRDRLDQWRWWIAYDLRTQQFIHIKDKLVQIPLHLLPLRSVLRTADFARRTRDIASSSDYTEPESVQLLDRADAVQRAIREYRIPMTVMRSGSLDDAVTIFARVNQRGRDMTPDQMVSALTFRDSNEGDFDLSNSIDDILGELRGLGFGDLQRRILLQIILALADLDFTRPSYERIVDRSSHRKLRPAVEHARAAVIQAVKFLVSQIGLRTSRLLPYASIIVMLAIYFGELTQYRSSPDDQRTRHLQKWFWATSFNGWFAGANTTEIRQAGEVMRNFAHDTQESKLAFDSFFFDRVVRPFPRSYDRRSARVRASLLVQMLSGQPSDLTTGQPLDGFKIFASVDTRDIPYFFPNQKRPAVSNPANRVILPDGYPRNARAAFMAIQKDKNLDKILASHFVSKEAFRALIDDRFDDFIALREAKILEAERQFLSTYGLVIGGEEFRNNDEIDSNE